MIPLGRTLRRPCMLAALLSSAVNSTGITHGMAAGGIGIRGRTMDIGTGTLTDRRVHRRAVDRRHYQDSKGPRRDAMRLRPNHRQGLVR